MQLDRRHLIVAAGGLGLAACRAGSSTSHPAAPPSPVTRGAPAGWGGTPSELPFRISLAQWSLHRMLRAGELDALGYPAYARERFGVEAVEYVNQFFADKAGDFRWLGELRRRCADAGVRSLLIMVDGEGKLADADDGARLAALHRHFKWIAAAGFLGCHAVRVNAAGSGKRGDQAARAADSLHQLGTLGEDYGVDVIVENHGGHSSDGAWLADVMRRADHPRVGTLPDFGNFHLGNGEWYDRYRGVRELMPFARAVSAKSYDFDADGNERNIDYPRMLDIVLDAGYEGWIGIEYEGAELSEVEGVLKTKALLERCRAARAAG